MIHIEKGKLTITIMAYGIEEAYADTVTQLVDLLQLQNPDLVPKDNYYAVYNLLNALMPDWQQVKAMIGVKADDVK